MSKKNNQVLERVNKKVKGSVISVMREIKTDGSSSAIEKAVEKLQKAKAPYFEVVDHEKMLKTLYKLTLSGTNYEQKSVKI